MVEKTTKDFNRLDIGFQKGIVKDVLPSYFTTDYPNLISFLESYYEFMDSDGEFGQLVNDLYTVRDIEDASLSHLDNMFKEFALGMSQDFFTNPREILKNFARFFRVKGSKYSAEGFFRGFFGEDAEVHYPKQDIFMVGDSASQLGSDNVHVLKDGGIYQIISIMIKSPIAFGKWGELYKKFVHPAGFFLSNEVQIVTQKFENFAGGIAIFDSHPYPNDVYYPPEYPRLVFDDTIGIVTTSFADTTLLQRMGRTAYIRDSAQGTEVNYPLISDSDPTHLRNYEFGLKDSTTYYTDYNPGNNPVFIRRLNPDVVIRPYSDPARAALITEIDNRYSSIFEWTMAGSQYFDRSDSTGYSSGPRFSNTDETMDEDIYDSGNSYVQIV